ncbi:MAG: response regulator transcription factor [Bacteroidota bacterium]
MKKVLLIEDDVHIKELLEIHLKDLECKLMSFTNGRLGYNAGLSEKFDLIILDIMLPEKDGLEICRDLRSNRVTSPILMLTARSEEIDKIIGLETGADDYLTKPFSVREFIARVKAIFRRVDMLKEGTTDTSIIKHNGLIVDQGKRKVTINNERIDLTPKEFDLLYLLAANPGKSYSRDQLLSKVWGYEFEGYEHTVNSHINRLRAKVEIDISNPTFILTTWGVGYRFNDDIPANH